MNQTGSNEEDLHGGVYELPLRCASAARGGDACAPRRSCGLHCTGRSREVATVETVNGVRLLGLRQNRYRGSSRLSYAFAYIRFLCAASVKVASLFRRERYDIIYVHTMPDLLVLVGLIPKLFGARIVLNIHDMMPELYMSKFGISEKHWLIRLLVLQEQYSIRLADEVICVHHPHRDVLCSRGTPPEKITVLPNVPDPALMPERSDSASSRQSIQNRVSRDHRPAIGTRPGSARLRASGRVPAPARALRSSAQVMQQMISKRRLRPRFARTESNSATRCFALSPLRR